MRLRINQTVYILLFFILFACEHSTGTGPDTQQPPTGNPTTFSKIQADVLSKSCALSNCHGGFQNPRLSAGLAYNNLVNARSSRGLDYIEPGDPGNSYLYRKITGQNIFGTSRMPMNAQPLAPAVIDSIRSWIERGAPND